MIWKGSLGLTILFMQKKYLIADHKFIRNQCFDSMVKMLTVQRVGGHGLILLEDSQTLYLFLRTSFGPGNLEI